MHRGCAHGRIDQHIKGFRALGADVDIEYGKIMAEADRLVGKHIYFDVVSVGATINVMMAATMADGLTIMENVAKEPHVVDVANFLNSMGANIRGAGTDVIDHTAFIMLSQVSSKEMISSAYEAGIEFFIQKPINSVEVETVINWEHAQNQIDASLLGENIQIGKAAQQKPAQEDALDPSREQALAVVAPDTPPDVV